MCVIVAVLLNRCGDDGAGKYYLLSGTVYTHALHNIQQTVLVLL